MSLIKFRRRMPLIDRGIPTWFDTSDIFDEDFFEKGKSLPPMNVKETEKTFDIELAIPGFSKDEIEISLENDVLQVSAEKEKETIEEDVEGYTRKEFSYNSFERKIKVPNTVNQEKEVKATYNNGVLNLQLVKEDLAIEQPKKKIEIK
ncbi:MAG: Hsp20/alpha crystallin family protein [Bacteroidia bacterium]|nr:Hsp20/alpha crystallin family protein [Bacteroidia bacterium]MBT8275445.1 Hsp20/alpha crystallin family protein [Bacteroidia bacterium]NNF30848.1 Hsp20/alpha crystallin family protein [Flavobacteriaceae bacterium]NNK54461.1 Hsp20/alpha crystallin family protein [Flavobacteriaceae bacterium]